MAIRNGALLLVIVVITASMTLFILTYKETSNQSCKIRLNRETPEEPQQNQANIRPSTGLLSKDGYVRDCITLHTVRNVSILPEWGIFDKSKFNKTTRENATQRQDSFSGIYKHHSWGKFEKAEDVRVSKVQGSGPGSTLNWAQEAMATLHILINEIKLFHGKETIKMLDIPCGDFVWMSRFLQERTDVKYTGMDIVPSLIKNHKNAFKNDPNLSFIHQDIVETPLDQGYDLILSRHMLQHLTTSDVMKVLSHLSKSGSLYLLTTTMPVSSQTIELPSKAGRFRYLNLEIPPVQLEPPLCLVRDGSRDGRANPWDLYLGLWKLPLKQVKPCNKVKHVDPKPFGANKKFYSCV